MESTEDKFPDDDEDEVVHESVVHLTKSLSENLYLFHYPIKHSGHISQDARCLSAKIKPKQQKVELEFGIDIDSRNYDTGRGEQIAYNVDGQNSNGECYFNSGIMDKKLLVGTKAFNSNYSHALGFMRKGKFHVVPLHSIIEMNPGFIHMDKIDSSTKKNLKSMEEEEEEAVAVTVRFEGPNAERDRQFREKSHQYFLQKSASESWVNLNYHKQGSVRSTAECEKLYSEVHQKAPSVAVSKEDYLKELVPECLRLSGCQTSKEEDEAILLSKPLSDQIRHLMINAQLLTFKMLAEKLPQNVDTLSIERLLQQIGVLVQGCWAVKSELLYAENTVSPHTGMVAKQLINARDYILWLFTKTRFVTRQDILSAIRILDADFKAIMLPLAKKADRSWEFMFPTDEDFLENHPSIQQSQDIKWNLRYNKLVKDLKMSEREAEDLPRPRSKRPSHSSVSEGDESGTDSVAMVTNDKGKRAQASKKRINLSPTKAASKPRLATLDISPTYLESVPPEGLRQELRELLGATLRQHFCMTLTEIRECVLESPLSSIASRTDFETLVDEALREYGAQKLKNKWPQNTTSESLYAFAKFGNKLDRYRATLLDLFSTTARTRANLFVKKVEDELRERISEADCRQIFEEYCVYKSGFYYLKGTIALES